MMHVICGAPCSGKTSYVKQHAKPGEIIVDLDRIAEAIGSGTTHQAHGPCMEAAMKLREVLIEFAKASPAESWVIHTKPSEAQIRDYKRHGADIITIDPGIEVCKRRAEGRPDGTKELIDEWYSGETKTTKDQFADWFEQVNE